MAASTAGREGGAMRRPEGQGVRVMVSPVWKRSLGVQRQVSHSATAQGAMWKMF